MNLILAALRAYRRFISPALPTACRYIPTCSDYAMEAVERHGALRGGWMALIRFLRCNPFGGHGYDPVTPEQNSAAGHGCCSISK